MEFQKVSVGLSGVMHLARMDGHKTLCGRWWWADNDHGDSYCQTCQYILSLLTKRAADLLNCPQCEEELHNGYCSNCKAAFEIASR